MLKLICKHKRKKRKRRWSLFLYSPARHRFTLQNHISGWGYSVALYVYLRLSFRWYSLRLSTVDIHAELTVVAGYNPKWFSPVCWRSPIEVH